MEKHTFFSAGRLSILAVLLLIFSLTACGQDSKKSVNKQTTQEEISQIEKSEPDGSVLVAYFSLADGMPDGADAVAGIWEHKNSSGRNCTSDRRNAVCDYNSKGLSGQSWGLSRGGRKGAESR